MLKLRGTYMDNTISYTRRREDSAVYKVTIRKQLTAIQMRSVKGHLYNNPYYEWEEDKQRYRLGDGLYMRFGAITIKVFIGTLCGKRTRMVNTKNSTFTATRIRRAASVT